MTGSQDRREEIRPPGDPESVLITGATGFIGSQLTAQLLDAGCRVTVLTRNRRRAERVLGSRVISLIDLGDLAPSTRIDAVVNLAGAPIAGGWWSKSRRQTLLNSRVGVTRSLVDLVGRLEQKPRTLVSASAIGYYGVRNDSERLHEKSPPQDIFQSRLCQQWEETASEAGRWGTSVALLRIGLVLGNSGGALPGLARSVHYGLGACLGGGDQWMSWIHLEDVIRLIRFVLQEGSLGGPLNATAPEPATHRDFMTALAQVLGRRLLPFRVPAPLLRSAMGELAQLFVDGQRVVPARASALGFEFSYPTLRAALTDLMQPAGVDGMTSATSASGRDAAR